MKKILERAILIAVLLSILAVGVNAYAGVSCFDAWDVFEPGLAWCCPGPAGTLECEHVVPGPGFP